MNKKQIAILMGGMCCLLTIGIFVQIKTIASTASAFGKTQTENELRDSVSRWQENYENAQEKLDEKEKELENLRDQAASNSENSNNLSKNLADYNTFLGYSELVGPGVIVTLKDGNPLSNNAFLTNYIVHDEDIYEVVNALKNAGADAISVNGQRVVSSTAITCIGNVVKINNKKIGAPFVISAIGSPTWLYSSLTMVGGYLEFIENLGVQVDVKQVEKDEIVIPKYEGVYKYEYARRAE